MRRPSNFPISTVYFLRLQLCTFKGERGQMRSALYALLSTGYLLPFLQLCTSKTGKHAAKYGVLSTFYFLLSTFYVTTLRLQRS